MAPGFIWMGSMDPWKVWNLGFKGSKSILRGPSGVHSLNSCRSLTNPLVCPDYSSPSEWLFLNDFIHLACFAAYVTINNAYNACSLKGKKTRHYLTDGVPCLLWDIDPWLTPISLLIPQMWCKCMNYMNLLSNIKEVMHFSENQNLTPMTPNDPRLTFDPKKDRGSQAYAYVWVT